MLVAISGDLGQIPGGGERGTADCNRPGGEEGEVEGTDRWTDLLCTMRRGSSLSLLYFSSSLYTVNVSLRMKVLPRAFETSVKEACP